MLRISTSNLKAKIISPENSSQLVTQSQNDSAFFRALEAKGHCLNRKQIEAVRNTNGPLLIIAGAGSGKTACITARTAYLMNIRKVNPENILVITFTRKAADELKHRLQSMTSKNNITACTIHALCYRILRMNNIKSFKFLTDERQKEGIIKRIIFNMSLNKEYPTEYVVTEITYLKNTQLYENIIDADKNIVRIMEEYECYKKEHTLMDFDDLLIKALRILVSDDSTLETLQNHFQYICLDEAQDINPIMYEIVKLIAAPKNNICCVLDPRQTIYSFRGSNMNLIMGLNKTYKNTSIVELNINYRSTASIIGLANKIIEESNLDFKGNLYATKDDNINPHFIQVVDSNEEAKFIVNKIKDSIKVGKKQYKDFCILYRSSTISRAIYEELTVNNIPFITSGSKDTLYENEVVKPVVDYLRLIINPMDFDALQGVLHTLYLNRIKTMQHINKILDSRNVASLLKAILFAPWLESYQYNLIERRAYLINDLKGIKPLYAIQELRKNGGYNRYLKVEDTNLLSLQAQVAIDMLQELEDSAARFQTIEEFIAFINELKDKSAKLDNLNDDAVSLISIHSSKGLEFKTVFLLSAIDGVIPHKYVTEPNFMLNSGIKVNNHGDLEEERRLLYVAITRAKEELYITIPEQYHNEPTRVSRFLEPFFNAQK